MAEGPSNAHLVVDGSNIATEGRSLPSLRQLDEAVRALLAERPHETWTVVVDATFGHRIDNSEKQMYEEALAANELVTPPAGTIGRGDKFLLEVADRANATVFSNDSFQEFHGEYEWLFDDGRLIGGKPVPEVGWIFTARTPVRGPKSRMSSRAAADRRGRGSGSGSGSRRSRRVLSATEPLPVPSKPPPRTRRQPLSARSSADSVSSESVEETAASPSRSGRGGRSRRGSSTSASSSSESSSSSSSSSSVEPVNEPLPFIEFIADNGPGSVVQGEVATFTSHGAFVQVGDVRCYLALKLMGDPAPRSARDILNRGEVRDFVVHALDAPRRGIDLALPGVTAEVVSSEEEVFEVPPRRPRRTRGAAPRLDSPSTEGEAFPAEADAADEPAEAPARKAASSRKATAKKATTKKAAAKKATTKKAAVKKATTKKAATKKATTKKAAAKAADDSGGPVEADTGDTGPSRQSEVELGEGTVETAPATKKAAAKKAPAKKKVVSKKAPAKKAPAKRKAASKKATAKKKATPRKASAEA